LVPPANQKAWMALGSGTREERHRAMKLLDGFHFAFALCDVNKDDADGIAKDNGRYYGRSPMGRSLDREKADREKR
jgi:hypothetical protein